MVLLSAAEGEDKPLKYPPIFKSADVVLLTKIDVAEVLGFDLDLAAENVRRIAPQARLIPLSARSGEGLGSWYDLLGSIAEKDDPMVAGFHVTPGPSPSPMSCCGCAAPSRESDSVPLSTGSPPGSGLRGWVQNDAEGY